MKPTQTRLPILDDQMSRPKFALSGTAYAKASEDVVVPCFGDQGSAER